MASVQSNCANKYARCGLGDNEAPHHLESAGEVLIKQLVQKQKNTNITLEQQLCQEKQFERGVGVVSLEEITKGTSSLEHFQERWKKAEAIIELEGRGISKSEAMGLVSGSRQSKATLESQAAYRQRIIKMHPTTSSPTKIDSLKRRDLELALSVKPNSLETRLYQFAIKNASNETRIEYEPSDHPIHDLQNMADNLSKSCDLQTIIKTIRRKRRQQLEALEEPQGPHFKQPLLGSSLWDEIEKPLNTQVKPNANKKTATCRKQVLYTIKDGKIVRLEKSGRIQKSVKDSKIEDDGDLIVNDKIEEIAGKLTEEEIKQLPRFKNYERGQITKTLYIKNLTSHVTESDLVNIFKRFQSRNGSLTFRLMTGKMRGQAFVQFPSSEIATEALEKTNGIILKGKPMVIQYGKQQE